MPKLASIALAALLVMAAALPAAAQPGFALDRFAPAPTSEDGLALILPRTLGHLRPSFGLTLDYAHKPLVVARPNSDADGALSQHRLLGHVTGALGLGSRFELFVRVPLLFVQRGEGSTMGVVSRGVRDSAAFGTLSLGGGVRLLGEDDGPLQLGATAWLELPTGREASLVGDDGVGFGGVVTASANVGIVSFALNAGGRYRPKADYGSARIGSELLLSGGVYVHVARPVTVLGELSGALYGRDFGKVSSQSAPYELLVGARVSTPLDVALTGALGLGLTEAVGTPDVRGLLQVVYPNPRSTRGGADMDHDGVLDARDRCPELAEDVDGHHDEDGCPDLDNDQDGIADARDQCGEQAEDHDGIQDEDGCPDLDNDADGVPDERDQCMNAAEDLDGHADEDGCPDLDDDGDGLIDHHDQCPRESEDRDGFADEDGCPDPDNDKDGVPDDQDACSTVPGPREARGCPSAVRMDKQQIRILQRIEFGVRSAQVTQDSLEVLDQVRLALEANPQLKRVRIEGHTDNRGPAAVNRALSQRRAEAVMAYLVGQGVDPGRLEAKGWGDERPLVRNDSAENMQINRRVEFHLVDPAPQQSSIGGQP